MAAILKKTLVQLHDIINEYTHARKMAAKYYLVQLHDMGYTPGMHDATLPPLPGMWPVPREARYNPFPHSLGCDWYPGKPATTLSPLPAPGLTLPIYC